jgi:hypothetical protein
MVILGLVDLELILATKKIRQTREERGMRRSRRHDGNS